MDAFIHHPNDIKSLPQGGAYLVVKVPSGTINAATADTRIERVHINALTDEEIAGLPAKPAKPANTANTVPQPQPQPTPDDDADAWPDAPDWA